MRPLLLLFLCAASYAQPPGVRGAFRGTLSAPVVSGTPQYDLLQQTFTATTSGVSTTYLQDLTTATATFTPASTCTRGDGTVVSSLAVLGYISAQSGASATWTVNASFPCAMVWHQSWSVTDGTTTWNSSSSPATPSADITVSASSRDGFLRTSGKRFIYERTGAVGNQVVGVNQELTAAGNWSCGGCGVAGADMDGTASNATYFGLLGANGLGMFRFIFCCGSLAAPSITSFNGDAAGHNTYSNANDALWLASLVSMHANGIHFQKGSEACKSSSAATSGASYAAITNALRRSVAISGWGTDAWEVCNEYDSQTHAFFTAVRNYIRSVDPYLHPVTTSFTPRTATPTSWSDLDIVSAHNYTGSTTVTLAFTDFEGVIDTNRGNYATVPQLVTESGNEYPIQNSDDSPWRFVYQAMIALVKASGLTVWDTSYTHPTTVTSAQISNMYVGPNERTVAGNIQTITAGMNVTCAPPGNISVSSNQISRGCDSTSGNADKVGIVADSTGFGTAHTSGATVTTTFQTSGMTIKFFDPVSGSALSTQTPSSGAQTLTLPAYTGALIWRSCVHGNSGCPL